MIRRIGLAALLALTAAPALAQTPPATLGARYVPAPWWMQDPVIASTGRVRVEIAANRASFGASFQAIDRDAAAATGKAADQVRALSQALAAYGVDAVRVETTLNTRPLYEQYRDADGDLVDNERADKIQRYEASANISITLRDMAVLERVYATVVASQPTAIGSVGFSLEPENAWVTNLAGEAVRDARARAVAAARDAGATLGPVRVIDPTGRACQTDVLTGWGGRSGPGDLMTTVEDVVVTGSRTVQRSNLVGPPSEANIEAARLALQPPLRVLTDSACVVYGLN
ncbi:MAG: SIMPL domain-containing protein [Brevundimonas sp.]